MFEGVCLKDFSTGFALSVSLPGLTGQSSIHGLGCWIANRNRMLPISILLVSAEVGQARLRVKPGDGTRASVKPIAKCSSGCGRRGQRLEDTYL
jgi:hypothetical protein